MAACFYCGMVCPLLQSLARRVAEDTADRLVALRRRLLYLGHDLDDVLPDRAPERPPRRSARVAGVVRHGNLNFGLRRIIKIIYGFSLCFFLRIFSGRVLGGVPSVSRSF